MSIGSSSSSFRDMFWGWEAEIRRANVEPGTNTFQRMALHGIWPVDFFVSPAFIVWIGTAYASLMVLWLIYRDRSRRLGQITSHGLARVAWNAAWALFSATTTVYLTPVVYHSWYQLGIGWLRGSCLSLETSMAGRHAEMVLLFSVVALRPIKLYEVLFSEMQGTTESRRLLTYHLLSPVLCWVLSTYYPNTSIMLAWAVTIGVSDATFHAYFVLKDLLVLAGLHPTRVMKSAVIPSQMAYCIGGFLLVVLMSDCRGGFVGTPRLLFLVGCAMMSAAALGDFNVYFFGQPQEQVASPRNPAQRNPKGKQKRRKQKKA